MWRSVLVVVLIIGAVLVARQISGASPITYTASQPNTLQQNTSSDDDVKICRGNDSSTYEADGKRYSLPFEVVDDQAVLELRNVGGQIVGKGLGEILLVRIACQGFERQYDNGEARRRCELVVKRSA